MRKIYIFLIEVLILVPKIVFANSINSIDMDIYIDNSGTAHVTEVWDAYLDTGTEGYKPYYNLRESVISNFKVYLNDSMYSYVDSWNINGSFDDKKYKNGFNYIDDGIELCFGISEYGRNTYKLTYDISDFVIQTSDGYQMIYWTLFPHNYNPSPGNVKIKIYSDFKYSDNLDVWGYGKGDIPTYVYDGVIEIDSEGTVYSSEYITVLVKFPSDTFNLVNTLDNNFDYYYNMAEEGAIHNSNKASFVSDILPIIISLFFPFMIVVISLGVALSRPKYGTYYKIVFGKNKIKEKDVPYFRDIPYKKEQLSRAYYIACQYNLIKRPTDYLGAVLLKWLKLGNIILKKDEKKKTNSILFNNCANLDATEVELYRMMYEASKDGILEKGEFELWCKKNYSEILKWFNAVIDNETLLLIDEGLLIKKENKKKCMVTSELNQEAKKVIGLKKFLKDFSNIDDRNAISVNLWDEYLMYAYIFGMAKKVMKEFKNLYPEVITEEVYNDFDFIYFIAYHGMNNAISARNEANSYSAGGGGGGSFGGGGGGGGFR
ncbi:MAG: DUF2207 family protein [Bacilli bacterium]